MKTLRCVLSLVLLFVFSGCAATSQQKSSNAIPNVVWTEEKPQIEIGKRNILFDGIGNITGVIGKILLWNIKVENHNISDGVLEVVEEFVAAHPEIMASTKIRVNQFHPVGEFKRLVDNKKMKWWWRTIFGPPVTIVSLFGRIIGGDHYNPFTDTVNIYSDLTPIAVHELGHAKDFTEMDYPGLYAIARILPFVTLYQEFKASDIAFDYFRETENHEQELQSFQLLYPAYGTYVGNATGLPFAAIVGAVAGHIVEIPARKQREKEINAMKKI